MGIMGGWEGEKKEGGKFGEKKKKKKEVEDCRRNGTLKRRRWFRKAARPFCLVSQKTTRNSWGLGEFDFESTRI